MRHKYNYEEDEYLPTAPPPDESTEAIRMLKVLLKGDTSEQES